MRAKWSVIHLQNAVSDIQLANEAHSFGLRVNSPAAVRAYRHLLLATDAERVADNAAWYAAREREKAA